jgi:hypothetical protein
MPTAVTDLLRAGCGCLLLVHPEMDRLEDAVAELLKAHEWQRLAVGRELSAALLSEALQHRSLSARRWMRARIGQVAPGPAVCTEIDLLFDPGLSLDPLRLFRDLSRTTRLVVAWPGSHQDDVLAYAVPEHSHYRTWRKPEVSVVALE